MSDFLRELPKNVPFLEQFTLIIFSSHFFLKMKIDTRVRYNQLLQLSDFKRHLIRNV